MAAEPYPIPAGRHRQDLIVNKSRFIATADYAPTVDAARGLIAQSRAEMPDANHHVYGFHVGWGKSIIEGMSDDGEPTGTAGPPVLAVVRGAAIGDLVVVVTRYFGGILLGTGGLVRAYTEAAQLVLATLPTELNIPRVIFGLSLPYPLFEQVRRLIHAHAGELQDESFAADVTLIVRMPQMQYGAFEAALTELSAGTLEPIPL